MSEGVRLEDCTGNVLGYLPTDEVEEEAEGEGEGETFEEGSEGEERKRGDGNWKNRIYRSKKIAMGWDSRL